MQNILVATDGSDHGGKAVEAAAEIAAKFDTKLIVAHVLMHRAPPERLARMARIEHMIPEEFHPSLPASDNVPGTMNAILKDVNDADKIHRLIAVLGDRIVADAAIQAKAVGAKAIETHVLAGDYADEIVNLATNSDAGMIVVGSRGLGTFREFLLGSISRKILHAATCPVLIVK